MPHAAAPAGTASPAWPPGCPASALYGRAGRRTARSRCAAWPASARCVVAGPRQDRDRPVAATIRCQRRQRGSCFQVVGAHEPDERRRPGNRRVQLAQRVDGVAGVERRLDAAGQHPPPVGDAASPGQPLRERRHPGARLQRVARRYQQPDLVQPQPPSGQVGNMTMPLMRRVERSSQQPDAHPPPVAEARDRAQRDQSGIWRGQGRT